MATEAGSTAAAASTAAAISAAATSATSDRAGPSTATRASGAAPHRVDGEVVLALAVLVATIGLADSLNPSTLGPALVIATGEGAIPRLIAFPAGVFSVSLAGGLVLVLRPGWPEPPERRGGPAGEGARESSRGAPTGN
jgi:hypothetical protein